MSPRAPEAIGEATISAVEQIHEQAILLPVADIDDSGRLRPVDSLAAEGVAASMRQIGLLHPIDVCRMPGRTGYRLVAGGHRLTGAKLLGWSYIPGFVRSADALDRKAREIAENLFKADLAPLDRAAFVRDFMEVEKARLGIAAGQDGRAMNTDKRSIKKQQRDDLCTLHKSLGLQANVAARLGLTQSTVSRDLALNGIAPSLLSRVRTSVIGTNAGQLRALAKLTWSEQEAVMRLLYDGVKARNVAQALGLIRGIAPVPADTKRLSTFLDTFNRMGVAEKRTALKALEAQLPKGITISFGVEA